MLRMSQALFLLAGCDLLVGLRPPPDDGSLPVDVPPVDADPDPDNDGVNSDTDNCPDIANANQENEDGDMLGDVCDKCPHRTSLPDNPDFDTDGVGDECDPNPMVAGDVLVMFDGFNDPTLPGWMTVGAASWTVSGGSAHVTTAAATARLVLPNALTGSIHLEAELDVASPTTGGGGVLIDYNVRGTMCGFRDLATDKRGLYDFAAATDDFVEVAAVNGGNPGTAARYVVTSAGLVRNCVAGTLLLGSINGPADPHMLRVGLVARDATMNVKWFVAILSP